MSQGQTHHSVIVLGAGLTGLSAALELQSRGVDFLVVEREQQVGGHTATIEDSGYRFDRTGHLLHLRNHDRRERILSLLDEPPLTFHRESLVFSEGVYTKYPYQANTFGLPVESAYACVMGFLQAQQRRNIPEPDNFEQYCRTHFGDAIAERFMLPYNSRLWGVPPSDVTTEWCDRFVPLPSLEDVIAGAVGKQNAGLGYNATGYYPRRGMGELALSLERRIGKVTKSATVRHIDPRNRVCAIDQGSRGYQSLISTLPLPQLLALFTSLPEHVSAAALRLRCTPLFYLDVALNCPPKRHFHWIYVPESRFPFYRVGNYAAFSPAMAPPKAASLYVELVSRDPQLVQNVWPSVAEGLIEMGVLQSPTDVAFVRLRHLSHAYVIYDRDRTLALETIQQYLRELGIISTGRYGGWNYSSMEDALGFGEAAASETLKRLS